MGLLGILLGLALLIWLAFRGWSVLLLAPGAALVAAALAGEPLLASWTEIFMGGAEGSSDREMDEVNRAFIGCVQAATAIVRYPLPGTRWRRGIVGRARLEKFFRHYLPARRAGDGDDIFSVGTDASRASCSSASINSAGV